MFKIALLTLTLAGGPVLANEDMQTDKPDELFVTTLKKELTNRATARYAIAAILGQDLNPTAAMFWQNYAKLEELNQARYMPVATELQLEPGTLSAWLKGRSAALYYRIAPNGMLNTMADATLKYYQELDSLTGKIAARHSEFYQYVLAQEEAQVEAFALAASGDYRKASERLDSFVQSHTTAQ